LASSRSGKSTAVEEKEFGIPGSPTRTSFAKIREPLEVPNLLALQTESFDWLVGNDRWRSRVAADAGHGPGAGLEEILGHIARIADCSGAMTLSFSNPR
jgi:DNA-directed RNA polymerase subunit beta